MRIREFIENIFGFVPPTFNNFSFLDQEAPEPGSGLEEIEKTIKDAVNANTRKINTNTKIINANIANKLFSKESQDLQYDNAALAGLLFYLKKKIEKKFDPSLLEKISQDGNSYSSLLLGIIYEEEEPSKAESKQADDLYHQRAIKYYSLAIQQDYLITLDVMSNHRRRTKFFLQPLSKEGTSGINSLDPPPEFSPLQQDTLKHAQAIRKHTKDISLLEKTMKKYESSPKELHRIKYDFLKDLIIELQTQTNVSTVDCIRNVAAKHGNFTEVVSGRWLTRETRDALVIIAGGGKKGEKAIQDIMKSQKNNEHTATLDNPKSYRK